MRPSIYSKANLSFNDILNMEKNLSTTDSNEIINYEDFRLSL